MAKTYEVGKHPDLPPPRNMVGPLAWMRENLFNGWVNSGLWLRGEERIDGLLVMWMQKRVIDIFMEKSVFHRV